MIQIFIADDHPLMRKGVVDLVSETDDIKVVGQSETSKGVINWVQDGHPEDIILLDLNMPDMSGLETLKQIKAINSGQKVLILSMYPENQYAVRVLKAGASGYLTKTQAPNELLNAIRYVYNGKTYISPTTTELLIRNLDVAPHKILHESLSDREFEIFKEIAKGNRLTDIARQFALSVKTVSTYKSRIMKKMDIHDVSGLVQYALKHNLID